MSIAELVLLGTGLSMDAATITMANIMAYGSKCGYKKWLMPLSFGLFQGLMPFLGSLLGSLISGFISRYASIVMFLIFAALGGKMLWDGFHCKAEEGECCRNFGISLIMLQALATSVDAFAVGVGLAASNGAQLLNFAIISATTFAICAVSLLLGEQFAKLLKNKATLCGGAILMLIAVASLF